MCFITCYVWNIFVVLILYVERFGIGSEGDLPSTICNVCYNVLCLEYSVVLTFIC